MYVGNCDGGTSEKCLLEKERFQISFKGWERGTMSNILREGIPYLNG